MAESECTCDYSYICPSCQAAIDKENQADYIKEVRDWSIEAIVIIAKALNVKIPDPPQKRGIYERW